MTVLKGVAINFTIIALSISNFITLGTGLETVVNNKSMLQSIVQGKKKRTYIRGNFDKDGHRRLH